MARVISQALLDALKAGRVARADLLLFDFPSGLYGFFSGEGTFTYNGVTYKGAGSLFQVDAIGGVSDGTAVPMNIRLNASAELPMNMLASIENEIYRGRPVTMARAYLDPDSYALLSVETVYRGYIDTIDHVESKGEGAIADASPGEAYLEAHVESRALDMGRSGWRRRSDADQRTLDPNDGSLRYLQSTATAEIWWGRVTPRRAR
ncbi:DUF2163 domain-containing protein [Labrys sp. KNU-23]|uniref:DUF2163 domain-containing protein n=1 Tax=Labrys sp. KNU-23 TaxID=2789216 RepID=UPI0011ED2918|nr:DUF2163 domain-containing protein [Labrys sp. KNU-23]QEN86874.1 DUF2163 domain-containing protein [Labrys sp. KNU-23]